MDLLKQSECGPPSTTREAILRETKSGTNLVLRIKHTRKSLKQTNFGEREREKKFVESRSALMQTSNDRQERDEKLRWKRESGAEKRKEELLRIYGSPDQETIFMRRVSRL